MPDRGWVETAAGIAMPWILYGTAWKEERTANLVVQAVRAGFRGIDTACQPKHYNEAGVGAALARLEAEGVGRESLFVQTKFTPLAGHDPARVPYEADAPIETQVRQSFETSQQNLGTPRIDSLVLHSPLAPHALLMRAWRAMERVHAAGGAGLLGISNCYSLELLETLSAEARVRPAVVQNRFYAATGYDSELRRWCARRGIVYQSFWTLTANPQLLSSAPVRALAARHGKTEAQILFRTLHQEGVVPLTGTTSALHMRQDLEVLDFRLTAEEVESVRRLLIR